ncbi:hypothetical protein PLICRDRAFT_170561 [Plicaturopsis crispa FD-325 SS-3]|nr:hypothetical protein PLICRDRAFT_170561 [Plicaturopsis crispa FD-325 SS-3]
MGIDGLIILDSSANPIIQSAFRSSPPAYPLLHVAALASALENASALGNAARGNGGVDPVLYLPLEPPSACCHVAAGSLRFVAPVSGDTDPLIAFSFIASFASVLSSYFPSPSPSSPFPSSSHLPATLQRLPSPATLREHFDTVYQLLEETLEARTTAPNALRDIVLPPSRLASLLANANINLPTSAINGGIGNTTVAPYASAIPWRKAGVRYTNNEVYFDVVEDLRAVVGRQGAVLSGTVWGRVDANVKLSGTPDLLLQLSNAHAIAAPAFHACVRLPRWKRDRALSFVPPDGRFTLMEYRFDPTASASAPSSLSNTTNSTSNTLTQTNTNTKTNAAAAKDTVPVPFSLRTALSLSPSSSSNTHTFEITIAQTSRTHPLEALSLAWCIGREAGGVQCSTVANVLGSASSNFGGGGGGNFSSNGGIGSSGGHGGGNSGGGGLGVSWSWDARTGTLSWSAVDVAGLGAKWAVRGSWVSTNPRPARALQTTFTLSPAATAFSALRVEKLQLVGGEGTGYKLYKGVRGHAGGRVEWRI